MRAYLGSQRVDLTDRDLLGVGGEGRVYRWRDRAVKIFHDDTSGAGARARARALALAKVRAFPRPLPREVVAPLEVVHDGRGEAVGFTMPIVESATEVMRFGQRKWRDGRVANAEVVALFARLHAVLRAVHARGVVVGDMNDGNVLFSESPSGERVPWLIDADSMQFGGWPCPVAHERFLDPRLFGADLSAAPRFDESTDWYAFAVLLFTSVLYVHPYGGSHPRIATMLRRAEARHSVLRDDVTYPRSALPARALPDEWIDWARAVFDEGARGAVPESLFAARWTRCACGVEHARKACPVCTSPTFAPPATTAAGFRLTIVRRTTGRVLAATNQGGLRYVVEEEGRVVREDGSVVLARRAGAHARFAIAGPATWVAEGDRLRRVTPSGADEPLGASTYDHVASFDANASTCAFVSNDWLVDATRGTRIGQVLDGQTWLRIGDAIGFGFYRAGAIVEHFVFRPGRGGLTRVVLPPLAGKLVDASAWFDGERVLVARAVDRAGRRVHELFVVAASGAIVAAASGAPDEHPMLGVVGARCLAHGVMLCATDDGLLRVRVDADRRALVPDKLFSETRGLVSTAADLLPGPGGSVYVVGPNEIVHASAR